VRKGPWLRGFQETNYERKERIVVGRRQEGKENNRKKGTKERKMGGRRDEERIMAGKGTKERTITGISEEEKNRRIRERRKIDEENI
jgi:hypothetical protein